MMSIRALGNLGASGSDAKQAAHYYSERSADYYVKGASGDKDQEKEHDESQGQWIGRGAKKLDLAEVPTRDQLQLSLAGHLGGRQVQNAGRENRQMGWDLTFSAPKSVSIAWGFADSTHRREILEAHQAATKAAFNYIESNTMTRRGYAGLEKEPGYLAAGMFTHHTSRAGDPQLHSHVVIPNFCVRSDGTVGTIESREFYDLKLTAGALYQAELSSRMNAMGYGIEAGEKGTFRVENVSPSLEKVFSKRGEQIDRISAEQGIRTYAGTRGIVISTRMQKKHTTMQEREETWQGEAKSAGLQPVLERGTEKRESPDPERLRDAMVLASQKLTDQNSTFQKKDYVRELARASYGLMNARQVQSMTELAQKKEMILELGKDKSGHAAFTTHEMSGIEQRMLEGTRALAQVGTYKIDATKTLEGFTQLSEEQKAVVERATGESGLAVIQGRAGTGKTTTLQAIRDSYELNGYRVQGIAISGQAAHTMQTETAIPSRTVAAWQKNSGLTDRSVLIVDEAGMVGSKQMQSILQKAQEAKAKVILVGDERQLQPINAGGALHAVDQELVKARPEASSQIETIRRQKEEWMRQAVYEAARGNTKEAIEQLDQKGKIAVFQKPWDAREALVNDYLEKNATTQREGLILTSRKGDASQINDLAREKLKEKGFIGDDKLKVDNGQRTIPLAVGDRLMMTKNDYNVGVRNGERGTLQKIDEASKQIQVKFDNGQDKTISLTDYKNIDYGWASTTHKAQGATVDRAYVYGHSQESMASQQATYVQISRAREDTRLYVVSGEKSIERQPQLAKEAALSPELSVKEGRQRFLEPTSEEERKEIIDEMKKSWSRDAAKGTSLEYGREIQAKEFMRNLEHKRARENDRGMEMER